VKLVRYGRAGAEKPGAIDASGALRDLSRVVKDITAEALSSAGLKRLRAVKVDRLPIVRGRPRLGCPLAGIGKMVCIGLNYTDHAREECSDALIVFDEDRLRRHGRVAASTMSIASARIADVHLP
jgi:hypothetical protein